MNSPTSSHTYTPNIFLYLSSCLSLCKRIYTFNTLMLICSNPLMIIESYSFHLKTNYS